MSTPGDIPQGSRSTGETDSTADEIVDAEVVAPSAPGPTTPSPSVVLPPTDYTESGVPTFDFVRDKIENRIATASGGEELAHGTPEGQQVDEMMRARDEAAKKKLDEIRKSMGR